jgi:hypothetical protein
MTESTTGNVIDPEGVNHPSYYNQDPSGVECIDVARHLGFDVGNAYKYAMRAGLKLDAHELKDLRKAVWYLDDVCKNEVVPGYVPLPGDVEKKMIMVTETRNDELKQFFLYVYQAYRSPTLHGYFWFLEKAKEVMEDYIIRLELDNEHSSS